MTGVGRDSGFGDGGRPVVKLECFFWSMRTQPTAWHRKVKLPFVEPSGNPFPTYVGSLAMEKDLWSLSDIHSSSLCITLHAGDYRGPVPAIPRSNSEKCSLPLSPSDSRERWSRKSHTSAKAAGQHMGPGASGFRP